MKPMIIQETRENPPKFSTAQPTITKELLDQLRYPVAWVYDIRFPAWYPVEVDGSFIDNPTLGDRYGIVDEPAIDIELHRAEFLIYGVAEIKQLFSERMCRSFLWNYYQRQPWLHKRPRDMEGIIRTSANDLPLMRILHEASADIVSKIVGEPVKASYSFTACYEAGSILPKHTDRPQCAYNISLILGCEPYDRVDDLTSWDLNFEVEDHVKSVGLAPGDAALYAGTKTPHWRDSMPISLSKALGVFFHYVPVGFTGSLR